MISGLITNWTAVVVLFLCSPGFVFPRVTSRQHIYSLVAHPQRDASSILCPSYSRQTCQCSHGLFDLAQIWGYAPSTFLKEKQFDSDIRSASAVTESKLGIYSAAASLQLSMDDNIRDTDISLWDCIFIRLAQPRRRLLSSFSFPFFLLIKNKVVEWLILKFFLPLLSFVCMDLNYDF